MFKNYDVLIIYKINVKKQPISYEVVSCSEQVVNRLMNITKIYDVEKLQTS